MNYDLNRPWLTLDDWQKEYISEQGNCFLLCGRQSGKTTAMSIKIAECAIKEKVSCDYMVVAFTEKQAYNLFFKVLMYLEARYPQMIKQGREKPTMHEINLKNGVCIMCHAAGQTGSGLRTYTLKKLFIDEAAPMAREIFVSVFPMLSVTGGTCDMSSTPRGKAGYFYECSKNPDFRKFYVSAEDCPRHDKKFLEAEKNRMSRLEYAQEYLAVFLDEFKRVFSDEWIKNVCILKRRNIILKNRDYFLGVDVARMGEDESSFEIVDRMEKINNRENIEQVENEITRKTLTTETEEKIINYEKIYKFRKIYIDAGSGSLGVGIYDALLNNDTTKRKVVAINNRERLLDINGEQKKKILKEDLYNNLLRLGERGEIKLLDDDEIKLSLASVQYEYVIKANSVSTMKIYGNYTHIAEGLVRAAYCAKEKSLKIWCY